MGREIDERVVQMKFENGQFEKGISTSIRSMEELKKGMDFDDAVKGFNKLDEAAKGMKLTGLASGVEAVRVKFDLLQITAFNVLNRISNKAIDTGERMVKGLSIDQVSVGWEKFASKTSSVQTIMAATASQFSDTSVQMGVVNEQLDKLNWFTDETSYNFVDMVNNIGKFTSNNIDLKTSVTAMQGIANWAAISGANANEASRAMYNLSQALSTGSVKLIDWKSIENANMATAEFKRTVIEMAAEAGTLNKVAEDTFSTLDGKIQISTKNFSGFNDSLQKGWFSTEVLMNALDRYGGATNKLNKYYEETGLLTSELVAGIDDYTAGIKTAEDISDDWGVSLGKTKEILEDFNNEQDQFGLKAFKAAQEAKTFEDAINSVKDAVSTGWMKSFEYIFGDYLEAKEFFTDLANVLYGIFAEGGEMRNARLEWWKDWGGRAKLIDSIWNALALVLAVLKPIQMAWRDIFGEMTAYRMLFITESLQEMMETLASMAEKNMPKLQRTFRGLFAILDMLRMLVSGGLRIAMSVLREIFGEFNVDIFEFTGSIGDSIVALRDWMKAGNRFDRFIDDIIGLLKTAISQVRSFINAIKSFGPVKVVIDSLHSVFTEDFHGIDSVIQFTLGLLSSLWNLIKSVPSMTSLDNIRASFAEFGKSVMENLSDIGISFEGLNELGEKMFGELNRLLQDVTGGFGSAANSAGSAIGLLTAKLNEVDWAGVALLATGIAVLALAFKIADSAATIAKSFAKVTDVMKSFKGMADSISGYFKALKENIKSNNILKVAIAIGILAAAFYTLAKLDTNALLVATGALAVITASIIGLLLVIDKHSKTKIGTGGASSKLAAIVIAFAASIAVLARALNAIDMEGVIGRLVVLGVLMAALTVVIKQIGKVDNSAKLMSGLSAYIGIAIAVSALVNALKKLTTIDQRAMYAALPILAGLSAILAAFVKLTESKAVVLNRGQKAKTMTSIGSAISIAIAMHLLIMAIEKLGKSDPAVIVKGLIGLGAVFSEFAVLMIASKMAGEHANKAGKMILYISIGLNLIAMAIKGFGKLDMEMAVKGLAIIEVVILMMGQLMVFSKFSGEHAAKAGLLIIAMAGALMAIQLVVKTLGRIDLATLVKGTAAISAIIVSMGYMIKHAGGSYNAESTKSFSKLIIIIGLLSAALIALSFVKPERALVASGSISLVLLSLGKSIKMMKDTKLPSVSDTAKYIAVIAALGVAIGVIAHYTDPKSVLATATGLSEVLLSVAAAGVIMKKAKMPTVKQAEGWAIIIAAIGSIIAGMVYVKSKAQNTSIEDILALTTGVSEILIALGVAGRIMDKQRNPSVYNTRAMVEWLKPVGILVGMLAGGLGGLSYLTKGQFNIDNILQLTTAISEILIALAASSRIMGKDGGDFKINKASLVSLTVFAGIMGGVLAIFSQWSDPVRVIPLATAMSEVMIALAGVIKIISTIEKDLSGVNVGMLAMLTIVTGILGAVMAGLSTMTDPNSVVPVATGLSIAMLALSGVTYVIAQIKDVDLVTALKVLGIMLAVVAAAGAVVIAMGWLMQNDKFETFLRDGGKALELFGQAIGGFFGGLVSGFANVGMSFIPTMGTYLSQFMQNAQYFIDSAASLPDNLASKVAGLAGAIVALGAAEFIDSMLSFAQGFIGNKDYDIVSSFEKFGDAMSAFSDALGEDFNSEKVDAAANAGLALASLEKNLPRQNGKLQKFLGNQNLADFGKRMQSFGWAIARFAFTVKNVDSNVVENAAKAGEAVAKLEKALPARGGKLQAFLGEQDLRLFGFRMEAFGDSIVLFAKATEGITEDDVNGAVNAGKLIAGLEKELPLNGGVLQSLLGSQSLDDFGSRLTKLGDGIYDFSESAKDISLTAVENATAAVAELVHLEKDVDESGGWGELFTSKSDFSSFSKNLKSLGEGLEAYDNSIAVIEVEDINDTTAAIKKIIELSKDTAVSSQSLLNLADDLEDFADAATDLSEQSVSVDTDAISDVRKEIKKLLQLSELTTASQWIVDVTNQAHSMTSAVIKALQNEHIPLYNAGKDIAYWLVAGVKQGMADEQPTANEASRNCAKGIKTAFENEAGIASPSVVMIEEGHWLVKGLAEGITSDMSAEEAAEKKASNIVAAFESGLKKIEVLANNRQLKYDIWGLNEGLNATDEEKQQKELELKIGELEDSAEKAKAQNAAFETAKQLFEEGSQQYIEAENNMLTAMKEMYTLRNEINEMQASLMGGDNLVSKNDAYMDYIKANKEAYKMLGWITEEDQSRLIEDAQKKTGFGLDASEVAPIDTQAIIDKALGPQQVTIAKEEVKKRVRSAASSGSSQGLTQGFDEGLAEAEDSVFGTINTYLNKMDEALGGFDRASRIQGWDGAVNTLQGYANGWKDKAPGVINSVGETGSNIISEFNANLGNASPSKYTYESGINFCQGMINGLNQLGPSVIQEGKDLGSNTVQGLTDGINGMAPRAISAAKAVAEAVAAEMKRALQINSPSKLTQSFGNYLDDGLALGMRERIPEVENATYDVSNAMAAALDDTKYLINSILESDDDFAPVITPVLNLDEMKAQGRQIGRIFPRQSIDLQSARLKVGSIADQTVYGQNGSSKTGPQTNYNFTQNNYSPKALDRSEIYRQTKNQFSRLKGATQR